MTEETEQRRRRLQDRQYQLAEFDIRILSFHSPCTDSSGTYCWRRDLADQV